MALTIQGVALFKQDAPARWSARGDGLDTVSISMSGPYNALNAFRDQLVKWASCPFDNNMFLDSWDNDDHKQYPRVTLKYTGCKGGVLPQPRSSTSDSVQTANWSEDDSNLDLMFYAPTATTTFITRESTSDAEHTVNIDGYTVQPIYAKYTNDLVGIDMDALFDRTVTTSRTAEELVPGEYWQHTITSSLTLLPIY